VLDAGWRNPITGIAGELAAFQLIELHPIPASQDCITG